MVKTWKTASAGEEACDNCGAVYEVKITRYPTRDRDRFNCSKCGHLIRSWNDTNSWSYTLKES